MQRRWQISLSNSVQCSVITMVAFVELHSDKNYMYVLFPSVWMWTGFPSNGAQQIADQEMEGQKFIYKHHTHPWLTAVIEEVAGEQRQELENGYSDNVDAKVQDMAYKNLYKTCPNCGDN